MKKAAVVTAGILSAGLAIGAPLASADTVTRIAINGARPLPIFGQKAQDEYTASTAGIGDNWVDGETKVVALDYPATAGLLWGWNANLVDDATKVGATKILKAVHDERVAGTDTIYVVGTSEGTMAIDNAQRIMDRTVPDATDEEKNIVFVRFDSPQDVAYRLLPEGSLVPIFGYTVKRPAYLDSQFDTEIVKNEYSFWSDFPDYPGNPLALVNSVMAAAYYHPDAPYADKDEAVLLSTKTSTKGGTITTYLVRTPNGELPLTKPLRDTEKFLTGHTNLTDTIDTFAKPLVDVAYERNENDPEKVATKITNDFNAQMKKNVEDIKSTIDSFKPKPKPKVQAPTIKQDQGDPDKKPAQRMKQRVGDFKKAVKTALKPKKVEKKSTTASSDKDAA